MAIQYKDKSEAMEFQKEMILTDDDIMHTTRAIIKLARFIIEGNKTFKCTFNDGDVLFISKKKNGKIVVEITGTR